MHTNPNGRLYLDFLPPATPLLVTANSEIDPHIDVQPQDPVVDLIRKPVESDDVSKRDVVPYSAYLSPLDPLVLPLGPQNDGEGCAPR